MRYKGSVSEITSRKVVQFPFLVKTNSIHFNCYIAKVLILCTECLKDLGVMLDSKLYFHQHFNNIPSQVLKLIKLIRFISINFSFLDKLKILYVAVIGSKLSFASVAWNNCTIC
jgi:hypothetical protein